jgi:hypothetical protein
MIVFPKSRLGWTMLFVVVLVVLVFLGVYFHGGASHAFE